MATETIEKATKTINVFIADPLSEDGIQPLRQATDLDLNIIIDTGLAPEELKTKIADVEVLLVRSQTTVTREIIEAAKNLREAADIMAGTPGALHLRTLSTLNDISSDQSNTVVFAIPLEILRAFETNNTKEIINKISKKEK